MEKKPSRMKASKVSEIVIKIIISLKIISDIFNVVICGINSTYLQRHIGVMSFYVYYQTISYHIYNRYLHYIVHVHHIIYHIISILCQTYKRKNVSIFKYMYIVKCFKNNIFCSIKKCVRV